MRFTDLFVKRPVLAIVVNLVILIAGLQSIGSLSVRQYPRSDIAVVRVSTVYTGANADLVRGFITTPLERVIASADGIDYMESSSGQSLSTITVHLRLNYDTNDALTQIQAKVAQVRNELPPEAEAPVIEVENADSQFAALYLSFSSPDLDQNQITDYLTRVVQPKLSAIAGVQRADILGDRTFAMRIWLKPELMAAHGIPPSMVRDALARNNYLSALGRTKGSMVSVNLVANTDLRTPEEFRQLVVKESGGVVVRIGDIADVVLGAEDYEAEVRFNGQTAVFMSVSVLSTANSLDVIRRVRAEIPGIQAQMPAGMVAGISYDATAYIEDSINEVLTTLSETLLIVIVVIFLFLGSLRSVLIPVIAIPISLVGAVFLMLVAGFSINLLTLLAIVLSVGLVVDDAIVMVENVERHIQEGKAPFEAAIQGARELVGPIVAITITLAAVYAPVGIQGGLTGALFREFAFTLAGAVIVSGVVALTLSPMMASKLLRSGQSERGFAGWINRRFDGLRNVYLRMLTGTLRYRPVVLVLWAIVALLIVPFYMFSQRELAPAEDQGVVFAVLQTSANATLDQTKMFAHQVAEVYQSVPETASVFQITFPTGGFAGLVTKPWSERTKTTQAARDGGGRTAVADPGHPRDPADSSAAARRWKFSRGPGDRLRGGAHRTARAREPARGQSLRQRTVHLCRRGCEVRPAAGGSRVRPRQAALPGRRPQPGGKGPFDTAWRRLRQSLQHSRPKLQGDSADQTRRAADSGPAHERLHRGSTESCERIRTAGAAVDIRFVEEHRRAARAEEIPAAECGAHPGSDSTAGASRSSPDVP